MKTLEQFIYESLDRPRNWKWDIVRGKELRASFDTQENRKMLVQFLEKKPGKYQVYFNASGAPVQKEQDSLDLDARSNHTDAFSVLSTVKSIIIDFLRDRNPEEIHWVTKGARNRIYDRILDVFMRKTPMGQKYGMRKEKVGTSWTKTTIFHKDGINEETELTEALDQPYEWKWTVRSVYQKRATFRVDQRLYTVKFEWYMHTDTGLPVDVWVLTFENEGNTGITGTGNAPRVFATVFKILQDFIKSYDPEVIIWSSIGEEKSRVRLYKKFFHRIIRTNVFPKYEVFDAKVASVNEYFSVLIRKNLDPEDKADIKQYVEAM